MFTTIPLHHANWFSEQRREVVLERSREAVLEPSREALPFHSKQAYYLFAATLLSVIGHPSSTHQHHKCIVFK
jgi:hypothetical protein